MSSMSRGKAGKAAKAYKVVKPKKSTKHTTQHARNYRFKSFNDRIANLKIDPLQRKRYVEGEETAQESTHTYFGSSLEQWKDTNLSATFTSFAKEVSPLCDNLPVVLYNEHRIMDILDKYLEKGDALAMEALLDLLSQFARDLDARFEQHFQRAVATVASVAAKHSDFAVIEWSFTCLAWLFKYLSRLLVPDLRPLYDLMAPYLGREVQKPFIVRFTAESLSFLLKKAALVYDKDKKPLDTIMKHMLEQCKTTTSGAAVDLQQQGVMVLLTDAIKGIQHGIHATGPAIIQSLLRFATELSDDDSRSMDLVVAGVVTSMIHHCTAEGFKPALDTIIAFVVGNMLNCNSELRVCSILLFTVTGVRKGTRVQHWKPIMKLCDKLVSGYDEVKTNNDSTTSSVFGLLAVALQTATVEAVLAARQTIEVLRSGPETLFLSFCDMVVRLGDERFIDFVRPEFQKFLLSGTRNTENPRLYSLIPLLAKGKQGARLKCHHSIIESMIKEDLSRIITGAGADHIAMANLKLAAVAHISLDDEQKRQLASLLLKLTDQALAQDDNNATSLQDFALSTAFEKVLDLGVDHGALQELWAGLCHAAPKFAGLPKYWSNVLRYVKLCKPAGTNISHERTLKDTLVSCLASPSHRIRQDCLDILSALYQAQRNEVPNALSIAMTIESTPISLESQRSLSMNIRRLPPAYSSCNDDILLRAIPTYCYGLLHIQLTSAWDDATSALAAMSETKVGEEVIIGLAQSWLDAKVEPELEDSENSVLVDIDTDGFKVFSDFECPNLAKLTAMRQQVFETPSGGHPTPLQKLSLDQRRVSVINATARSQALRVLNKTPKLAEKRSRLVVPVLLRWAGSEDEDVDGDGERWARKDQKALLAIFAKFVNPKVLYKTDEVHSALLSLCANGDVEIQRSALKAIMAWKDTAVTRYEEHLTNLLDEARFREELSVFLRDEDEDEEGIRPQDHAHLMPVLLRLLYGRSISGGKEGQSARRKAVFVALSRFGENTLEQFLDLALTKVNNEDAARTYDAIQKPAIPLRQQLGMLNMVGDMLHVLGAELERFASKLVHGVLTCTTSASQKLEQDEQQADASLLRSVRSAGLQCLVRTYASISSDELLNCARVVVAKLIMPRLQTFPIENAQGVSGVLRLFAAWSTRSGTAMLLAHADGAMLQALADLLEGQHTKPEAQVFVLQEILDNLVEQEHEFGILRSNVSTFVRAIGAVVKRQPPKPVLDASVQSFAKLADKISSGEEAADVAKTCTNLLTKPSKDVSAWTKIGLLKTLLPLVQRFDIPVKDELYNALAGLFSRLRGAESRTLLSQVLATLVKDDAALSLSAKTCEDMNATGARLDEPDHERRERAFTWIYEAYSTLNLQQWLPIVHNCLFYIRDPEDRVNRSSASHALQLFVDAAAKHVEEPSWKASLNDTVFASIERGVQEESELVRAEYLLVLGHMVEKLSSWQKLSNMQALVVGGDEEASFFTNVLHIQQHRRLRAVRRLADEASGLSSSNVSRIFLPLLEHFVFDAIEGDSGRTLTDQAVQTIGALSKVVNQSAFRAIFRRYAGYLKTKEDLEKTVLRLLGALVDGIRVSEHIGSSPESHLPAEIILDEQLPPLLEYLHQKDESTVDRRMPVAVTIVKLMLALPEAEFAARLPAVLTDVSHVLRSRSQEARDETRKALKQISALIGPTYFSFIVKELRTSLKRGYQLHVLSFTVHALLVDANFNPGDLDECLPDLMGVVMDDIFGVTGQEKDAEEYKSGMKEVKSSKSFDTMEHLARVTPIKKLGELIRPIRQLLSERLDLKSLKKIDDLLTRLRKGLDENPASQNRDMLAFCWEIVTQVYAEQGAPAEQKIVDERRKRFLVQPEAPKAGTGRGVATSYRFKLISFAFNLLRKVLRRHEDLQTPQNLAGFLPMAGDAIVQGQEEVKLSAVRLLSTIMRVPIAKLDANAPVYVKEAVAMIKGASNMTTDSVKAALELITSVLREKRNVEVKEKDMAILLKRLKTDIDEPDGQGVIYKFLRAVLGRKILITEVYELMDEVGKVMVTNADQAIRESARSAYLQFVMDYPQGKDRWSKQTSFLVGNLQYAHASGRKSVMEFMNQMLKKIGEDVLSEISPKIFVSLLPVLIRDNDSSCRLYAKGLIATIFKRADSGLVKQFLSYLDTWTRHQKTGVRAAALQCWAILLQEKQLPQKQLDGLRDELEVILSEFTDEETITQPLLVLDALATMSTLIDTAPAVGFAKASADLWQAIRDLPSHDNARISEPVATLLGTFFTDVASASSRTTEGLAGLPLCGSGGLEIGAEDMRHFCAVNLRALRGVSLSTSELLTKQIVGNLFFLGRCFAANEMPSSNNVDKNDNEEAEEDEEETGLGDDEAQAADTRTALAYLLRRLASMLMSDKFSIKSRTAALQTLAAIVNQIDTIPNLRTILRPLYALTDPTVPKPPGELHKALEDRAHETMDLIQKKVGSENYVAALAKVRTEAKARRDERRQKRRIEAVSAPDKWHNEKKRRYEVKKVKQKAKGEEARGKRRGW